MLQRFIDAQEGIFDIALREIRDGRKRSHWMWFIFPQLKGLGRSATSEYYGIYDLTEAVEYLSHPILGNRLREISEALLELNSSDAHEIFGSPDDLKLHSCMTLFDKVSPHDIFRDILNKFFNREVDYRTLKLLNLL